MTYGLDAYDSAYQKTGVKAGPEAFIISILIIYLLFFRFETARKSAKKIPAREFRGLFSILSFDDNFSILVPILDRAIFDERRSLQPFVRPIYREFKLI